LAGSNEIDGLPKPITVITFGSPHVGRNGYSKAFKNLEQKGTLRHLRVSNSGDIIPGFGKHCGVSIHLYENKQAKIKYGKSVNIGRRRMRSLTSQGSLLLNHSLATTLDRISNEFNSDLLRMSVEDFYEKSGANTLFRRQGRQAFSRSDGNRSFGRFKRLTNSMYRRY